MDPEITKQFVGEVQKKYCTVWAEDDDSEKSYITRVDNEFRCVKLSILADYREKRFFKGVDAIMLLYDPASRQTYERLALYVNGIRNHLGDYHTVIMIGVFDEGMEEEDREVPAEEARKKAAELRFAWYEVTPENNFNMRKGFKDCLRLAVWAKEGRDIINPMEALALCDEQAQEQKKHRQEEAEQALNEALPDPVVKGAVLLCESIV